MCFCAHDFRYCASRSDGPEKESRGLSVSSHFFVCVCINTEVVTSAFVGSFNQPIIIFIHNNIIHAELIGRLHILRNIKQLHTILHAIQVYNDKMFNKK